MAGKVAQGVSQIVKPPVSKAKSKGASKGESHITAVGMKASGGGKGSCKGKK
jgi:hypothetical protein